MLASLIEKWRALIGAPLLALLAWACGESLTGLRVAPCPAPPFFSALPVADPDFSAIPVVGGLGAPGHTLPTDHAGFYLTRVGVPVQSPGALQVTKLRRTTYLSSPIRQGATDFAVEFHVCEDVSGWFGHLTTLSDVISSSGISWTGCQTYSTATETVEACTAEPGNVTLSAGSPMGTAGTSAALALDVGLVDERVMHFYVAPQRYPPNTFHAVCPWEAFDAANQTVLFAKLRDASRPAVVPAGDPRCGTMQVDVAGTAKGVWAEVGVTGQVAGDERRYITLANYPYRPQDNLALSLGPTALGAMVAVVPRQTSGRVNRAFEHVTGDGLLHCYTDATLAMSWFISLSTGGTLTIERLLHAGGASPCSASPGTWAFGAGAVTLVR